jgi:hypothetical protein
MSASLRDFFAHSASLLFCGISWLHAHVYASYLAFSIVLLNISF